MKNTKLLNSILFSLLFLSSPTLLNGVLFFGQSIKYPSKAKPVKIQKVKKVVKFKFNSSPLIFKKPGNDTKDHIRNLYLHFAPLLTSFYPQA
ncbi:hypothetical protein ACFLYU_01165 [Candidatus Dependentiae bacterium]